MNTKRLLIAIVAVFVALTATDVLIHQVLLGSRYAATKELWRSQSDMMAHMPLLHVGHLLAAIAFTLIYTRLAPDAQLRCACIYGACIGLLNGAGDLMTYAVEPVPGDIIATWFISGIVQGIILGAVVFYAYKPKRGV